MKKTSVAVLTTATTIAAFVAASSAFASQNVANTSQKGSLLVWPLITVDQTTGNPQDTIVEMSNDAYASVQIECTYVNEEKGRVDFDFTLTAKATVTWDVFTLVGDHVNPPPFPTFAGSPSFTGNPNRGELVCFATNPGGQFQIAWNELTGTATVLDLDDTLTGVAQPRHAFKYNAWAFAARCSPATAGCPSTGIAPDNAAVAQGTPGDLVLSGLNVAGAYDACPVYNIANFMPNGSKLSNIDTVYNWLSIASCDQDLRESYTLHETKLDFVVWNANEVSFTGTYACVDSVETIPLASALQPSPPIVVEASNFDYATLATPNARFQVQGISATPPCPFPTAATGVLAVEWSSVSIGTNTAEDQKIGNTTQTAGAFAPPGFVLWDVAGSVPPKGPPKTR